MIVVRVRGIRVRLAHKYDSYAYDSYTNMIHTRKLIVCVDFLRAWQSYAYETEIHIFTSPSNAHSNHTLRILTLTFIIHIRFM